VYSCSPHAGLSWKCKHDDDDEMAVKNHVATTSRQFAVLCPLRDMCDCAGAGKALVPMFDSLASSVLGDNPALVEELRCGLLALQLLVVWL
jgi:hypothetical protein